MLSSKENSRYSRQIILPEIGVPGQQKLKEAKVLVIGAGGLGCPALQYLAAAGVGNIGIADGDLVEESNLQRQLLYRENEIGLPKALVAEKKIKEINPYINVQAHYKNINFRNITEIVSGYDVVVDGTDNFASRYLINDACVMLNKPFAFGSIFKFEGQVSVFNYKDGPTYRCVFPEAPQEDMPNCASIGVVATLPGIVGTLQANEVIKIITGIGEVLHGRLLLIDALTMKMQTFNFNAIEANKNITEIQQQNSGCTVNVEYASYDDLQHLLNTGTIFIDVREKEEHDAFNIGGINIPLNEMETAHPEFEADKSILLYCTSGMRSKKAAEWLLQKGFKKVLSLKGGIRHLKAL